MVKRGERNEKKYLISNYYLTSPNYMVDGLAAYKKLLMGKAKKRYDDSWERIFGKKQEDRELPVLRKLVDRPDIDTISDAFDSVIQKNDRLAIK